MYTYTNRSVMSFQSFFCLFFQVAHLERTGHYLTVKDNQVTVVSVPNSQCVVATSLACQTVCVGAAKNSLVTVAHFL